MPDIDILAITKSEFKNHHVYNDAPGLQDAIAYIIAGMIETAPLTGTPHAKLRVYECWQELARHIDDDFDKAKDIVVRIYIFANRREDVAGIL